MSLTSTLKIPISADRNLTLLSWRRMRKAGNEGLHKGAVPRYYHKQTIESITLALGMVTEPRLWDRHVRRTSASTTLGIVYDAPTIASEHDPHVRRINEFVGRLTRAALPGAHFVDFFPFMKYIPSRCVQGLLRTFSQRLIDQQVCQMETRGRGVVRTRLSHVRKSTQRCTLSDGKTTLTLFPYDY